MFLKVDDLVALRIFGNDAQQTKRLLFDRTQHLCGIQSGNHSVKLIALQRNDRSVLQNLPAIVNFIKEHTIGVISPCHTGTVQLHTGHQEGHRGIHFKGVFQLITGQVDRHQRVSRRAVGSGPQGRNVERVCHGDLTGREGFANDTMTNHRKVNGNIIFALRLLNRVHIAVGDQVAKAVLFLFPAKFTEFREIKVRGGQHLIEGIPVIVQIFCTHHGFEFLRHGHDFRIFRHRFVHRNQTVIFQRDRSVFLRDGHDTQIFRILATGNDQSIVDLNRLI